jgi:hypothetical protein
MWSAEHIEQTLHGYFDGHRLLATSIELARDVKHVLFSLSDMSGRSMVKGFETYLTGYPLPDRTYYVFARTWYAPEMERPGCVWTHSLLIPPQTLEKCVNVNALLDLFQRPMEKDFSRYAERLSIPFAAISRPELEEPLDPLMMRALMNALYLQPSRPVLAPARTSADYERMVIAHWGQQYPKLQRHFCFCTGALSARLLQRTPFDLQVVPSSTIREVKRDLPNALIVDPLGADSPPPNDALVLEGFWSRLRWSRSTIDAIAPDTTGAREYVLPIAELSPLVEAEYDVLHSASRVVEAIAERYSVPESAERLKNIVCRNPNRRRSRLFPAIDDEEFLQALAVTPRISAFPQAHACIEQGSELLAREPEAAGRLLRFLVSHNHNEFGECLLIGLTSASWLDIPGLLQTIARRQPSILLSQEVWKLPAFDQHEVFDAATSGTDLPTPLRAGIVRAMLEAGSDCVARKVWARFGGDTADWFLDWLETGSTVQTLTAIPSGWFSGLGGFSERVVAWVAKARPIRGICYVVAAKVVDPHSPQARSGGCEIWEAIPELLSIADADRLRLQAFLLALGLDSSSSSAANLVVANFSAVHRAVGNRDLGQDEWDRLFENWLPRLSWGRNWDRCERLRRSLVEKFSRHRWPGSLLLSCATDEAELQMIVESCDADYDGRQLLRQMQRDRSAGLLQLTESQSVLLSKYW